MLEMWYNNECIPNFWQERFHKISLSKCFCKKDFRRCFWVAVNILTFTGVCEGIYIWTVTHIETILHVGQTFIGQAVK